jgi:hypothetical protein
VSSINLSGISKTVEGYMLDSVTVARPAEPTMDPGTLALTKTYTTVYDGKAFIAPMGSPASTELGGQQVSNATYEIAIPVDADPILPNDEVTCTESLYNEQMVGVVFIVVGQIESTFLTHRRLAAWRKQDAS